MSEEGILDVVARNLRRKDLTSAERAWWEAEGDRVIAEAVPAFTEMQARADEMAVALRAVAESMARVPVVLSHKVRR